MSNGGTFSSMMRSENYSNDGEQLNYALRGSSEMPLKQIDNFSSRFIPTAPQTSPQKLLVSQTTSNLKNHRAFLIGNVDSSNSRTIDKEAESSSSSSKQSLKNSISQIQNQLADIRNRVESLGTVCTTNNSNNNANNNPIYNNGTPYDTNDLYQQHKRSLSKNTQGNYFSIHKSVSRINTPNLSNSCSKTNLVSKTPSNQYHEKSLPLNNVDNCNSQIVNTSRNLQSLINEHQLKLNKKHQTVPQQTRRRRNSSSLSSQAENSSHSSSSKSSASSNSSSSSHSSPTPLPHQPMRNKEKQMNTCNTSNNERLKKEKIRKHKDQNKKGDKQKNLPCDIQIQMCRLKHEANRSIMLKQILDKKQSLGKEKINSKKYGSVLKEVLESFVEYLLRQNVTQRSRSISSLHQNEKLNYPLYYQQQSELSQNQFQNIASNSNSSRGEPFLVSMKNQISNNANLSQNSNNNMEKINKDGQYISENLPSTARLPYNILNQTKDTFLLKNNNSLSEKSLTKVHEQQQQQQQYLKQQGKLYPIINQYPPTLDINSKQQTSYETMGQNWPSSRSFGVRQFYSSSFSSPTNQSNMLLQLQSNNNYKNNNSSTSGFLHANPSYPQQHSEFSSSFPNTMRLQTPLYQQQHNQYLQQQMKQQQQENHCYPQTERLASKGYQSYSNQLPGTNFMINQAHTNQFNNYNSFGQNSKIINNNSSNMLQTQTYDISKASDQSFNLKKSLNQLTQNNYLNSEFKNSQHQQRDQHQQSLQYPQQSNNISSVEYQFFNQQLEGQQLSTKNNRSTLKQRDQEQYLKEEFERGGEGIQIRTEEDGSLSCRSCLNQEGSIKLNKDKSISSNGRISPVEESGSSWRVNRISENIRKKHSQQSQSNTPTSSRSNNKIHKPHLMPCHRQTKSTNTSITNMNSINRKNSDNSIYSTSTQNQLISLSTPSLLITEAKNTYKQKQEPKYQECKQCQILIHRQQIKKDMQKLPPCIAQVGKKGSSIVPRVQSNMKNILQMEDS